MEKTSEGKLLELATITLTDKIGVCPDKTEKLLNLASKILTDDRLKVDFDAIYLVGQAEANESSVLERCAECFASDAIDFGKICLAKSQLPPNKRSYPDFATDWPGRLMALGIPLNESQISIFDFPNGPVEHTGTEMIGLVEHAKRMMWVEVLLIATPWHQLRSFLSAVAAVKKSGYPLRVWNCPGTPLPWNEQTVHSQGKQAGSRVDFIHAELAKIHSYSAKGDIATIDEGLKYIHWRDSQV